MAQKQETNGTWTYYGKYTNSNGERVNYKKRGFKTKREAKEAERLFKLQLDRTVQPAAKLFSELVDEFLNGPYATQNKASSYQSNKQVYNKLNSYFGAVPLKSLKEDNLQSYINELDRTYSKRYVEKIYYCLTKLFNYAVSKKLLASSPMKYVYRDIRKDETPKKISFWEPNQFQNFIQTVDNELYRVLFSFLYFMGTRKGEALALQWKDIDFINQSVRIEKTVTFKVANAPWMITSPKTKNSIRTITMPDELTKLMLSWKNTQSKFYGYSENSFVFGLERPLAQENLRRNLKQAIEKYNSNNPHNPLPIIRVHDFRHSHASFLINNMSDKFTDFDVAKRLGDTVATLHETYAHWFKQADKSIVDMMNQHQTTNKPQQTTNKYEELKQLKELLDLEIITHEEFIAKKKELLGI